MSDVEIYAVINSSLSNESIPLSLENVEAGFPLPNGGQIDRRLDVNSYLLDHPKATIAFTVSGESMIDAGILPGDLVLVDTMKEACDKDILSDVTVFDVYTGGVLGASGKKSVAIKLVFRSDSRTLADAEVNAQIDATLKALKEKLGIILR